MLAEKMSYANKRRHERYPAVLDVAFDQTGGRVAARSRDVSLGGMFIETDRALPYGTRFHLEVRLPALDVPVLIEATVRWSGTTGMGVQWGTLRAKETWAINQLSRRA